jgi:murein DD-endopeptidase MepM/ murein hydrolase activator NlpD
MRPLLSRGLMFVAATTAAGVVAAPAVGAAADRLTPLAPTFEKASRLATLESERSAASVAVFPLRGRPDWGEGGARFGAYRGGRSHEGQDVFAPAGTPLVAVRDGRIVEEGDDGGRGNYIAIWSPAVRRTFVYLHMLRPSSLDPGDPVDAGDGVGAVGCTGSCWGDHLHIELREGRGTTGRALDPLPVLRRLAARRGKPE